MEEFGFKLGGKIPPTYCKKENKKGLNTPQKQKVTRKIKKKLGHRNKLIINNNKS